MQGLVIAGTHSGVGKTTVATGIMAALRRRGYVIQPFKVGPDYIDPSYHTGACAAPSRNLDPWLVEPAVIVEFFNKAMAGKDMAIVEGVMGLYDGASGEDELGSTAHLAKLLHLPVVLVVDASAGTRSVGACVLGFKSFDRELDLAGVILNGIASQKHLELVKPSLKKAGVRLLGYLPNNKDLALPERHLGLIPTAEGKVPREFFQQLAEQVEGTINLDALVSVASKASPPSGAAPLIFPEHPLPAKTAIAVARDEAFSFYYLDSLELLESWGAELIPFSPLNDAEVPEDVEGVYIGGGFPELYAAELSQNRGMLESLQKAAKRWLPIYGECGGLMYLCESIEDQDGTMRPMAGILPVECSMKDTRLTLGYRTVRALEDNPLMKAGDLVKGHEFHLSSLKQKPQAARPAYQILDQKGRKEGFRINNVLASYIHLHLGSRKDLASKLIDSCCQWKKTRQQA
ncbi:cobyrinate a,c-diamide synthase [Acidobacteria bacterium AH-259-D05]|nr:cobyrinate a,c-diamide synthase [Acidobacteria bacterium AH-259-D05]